MTFDWSCATVGDFVDLQRGNTYQSKLLDAPGPVLLGLASIERDGGFRADKLRTYGGESQAKLLVYPGDMYVSLKDVTQSGDLLGSVARVPASISVGRMTQDTVKLIFKNELIDRSYLYWVLRSPEYREYCRARGMGTTNLSLSRDDFLSFSVPEPTATRISIQRTLDAIEERISLNRSINQNLEAMAQAIFKSWFVDFDPVKAKIAAIEQGQNPLRAAMRAISGKTDAELDQMPREHHDQLAATAALFPDEMEESELGKIPKGWRSEAIGYYFDLTMGQSPPGNTYNETGEGMPFYQGRTDFGVRFPTERVYCTAPTRLAKKGDVLVSVRAPVGDINVAVSDCAIGRGVAAVRYKHPSFALYVLRHQEPAFKRFESDGTVFGSINKKQFESLPFVVAPDELVRRFQSIVGPLDEKIESNEWQMRNLAVLRDTLLPKLLSGELSVSSLKDRATA